MSFQKSNYGIKWNNECP